MMLMNYDRSHITLAYQSMKIFQQLYIRDYLKIDALIPVTKCHNAYGIL